MLKHRSLLTLRLLPCLAQQRGFQGFCQQVPPKLSAERGFKSKCNRAVLRSTDRPQLSALSRRNMSGYIPEGWRALMGKFLDAKLVHEEGLARHYINKDIAYGEFNKYGRINPWCITDYFEASLNLFAHKDRSNNPELKHISLFARITEMNFKRSMESKLHIGKALKFRVYVSYIGRSSVCWDSQCIDPETDEELANYTIQMVTVDMNIRKPAPLVKEMVSDFPDKNIRERPPEAFNVGFKPENAFRHSFVVNWSDTDFNSHLNQADMVRMCIDCGSFAATQKALKAFSHELFFYDLKKCSIMFMKEARPGEEVVVECWEHEDDPLVLNFAFSKKGDLITLVQIEYYAGDPDAKL